MYSAVALFPKDKKKKELLQEKFAEILAEVISDLLTEEELKVYLELLQKEDKA